MTELRLYAHQEKALELASKQDSYALFAEMGTGKTAVAISLIKLRACPTLIICPLSIIKSVWIEELKKWHGQALVQNLWENPVINKIPDIGIINFESARKLKEHYLNNIQFIIVDESSKIKNPTTLITKFLCGSPSGRVSGLSDRVKYKLIMSGMPAPNSNLEYWSQMRFLDKSILGDNFYAFRSTYFYGTGYGGYVYKPRRNSEERIINNIKNSAFYISKDQCLDLPEKIFMSKTYEMTPIQRFYYIQMMKENIIEIKGLSVLGINEMAKIMKLRQITSGFVMKDNNNIFISDKKINLLLETIEEIGLDKKIVIWCQFKYEIREIVNIVKAKLDTKVSVLYGEVTQAEKEDNIYNFKNDDDCKILVANPRSGGMGLTFIDCSYNIYYSLDYSLESEKQSQDRTHRIGQKNKVTYIYLLAEDSIDSKIYQALRKKENMSDAMLKMINDNQ